MKNSTKTEPRKPKLNVKLLRRIKRHILAEPRRFTMRTLEEHGRPGEFYIADNGTNETFPECGTAACIAGWTNHFSRKQGGDAVSAARFLGIPYDGSYCGVADRLFFDFEWAEPFRTRYQEARTAGERAAIAADRIEHFIKTCE